MGDVWSDEDKQRMYELLELFFKDAEGNIIDPRNINALDSNVDSISAVPLYLIGEFSTITDNVMTISEESDALTIDNGNTQFTITVNDKTITIKPNRIYTPDDLTFETPFTTVTFSSPNPTDFQLLAHKRGYVDDS
jgi:hypothetical protein